MTVRLWATAAVTLAAAGAVVVGASAAEAAEAASCDPASEVTVVVDFASLGGGVGSGCTGGDPSSGVASLQSAGFTPSRAQQERSGYFLCRIDGKPASDPCQRAASSSAYWSYWHARPGGSWSFSNTGPGSYDPAPGSVEGWAFGAGAPPSTSPPAPAAAPAPPAAAPAPPQPAPPRAQAPEAPAPEAPAPNAPSAPPQAGAADNPASAPAATPPPAPAATPPPPGTDAAAPTSLGPNAADSPSPVPRAATAQSPPAGDLDTERASSRDDTSPAGPLAAAALVLALLLGGGWQLARRRRESA
ncbi:MAG: hypothetical protein ACR2K2_06280 [Mycobacteriales bacterium]